MKDFLDKNFHGLKVQTALLVLLPFVLLGILHGMISFVHSEDAKLKQVVLQEAVLDSFAASPYPILPSQYDILLSAQSAIVVDKDSQVVVFSRNPEQVFSMASTTKIMTALVAMEHFGMHDVITVRDGRTTGATVGLRVGQQFYFKDMLYAMLLPSGNDVARAIAQNYPGGEEAFVKAMNTKADALHLQNTHFADPTGLSENNVSNAKDLSILASYALQNKTFTEVVGTKNTVMSDVGGQQTYTLVNLNRLLGTDGVNGVKTGFTEEAGEVLVTSQETDNHTLIIVVMRSKNRFLDTQILISQVGKRVNYVNLEKLISLD